MKINNFRLSFVYFIIYSFRFFHHSTKDSIRISTSKTTFPKIIMVFYLHNLFDCFHIEKSHSDER